MPSATPAAAPPTRTALLVEVSEADPVVGEARARFDHSATLGVPAHVTVLVPFMAPEAIDPRIRTRLAGVFAAFTRFDARFTETGWFGDQVLWLAPEPADVFRALTLALADRFPDCQPYDGQHEEVVPHLTIAHDASRTEMERLEEQVRPRLPIRTTVSGVSLWSGSDAASSWRRVTTFRLG